MGTCCKLGKKILWHIKVSDGPSRTISETPHLNTLAGCPGGFANADLATEWGTGTPVLVYWIGILTA